jgi:hypothetical protein
VIFFQDLEHSHGAFAAGRALAARFILNEIHEEPGHIHHACLIVHDDHPARPMMAPTLTMDS